MNSVYDGGVLARPERYIDLGTFQKKGPPIQVQISVFISSVSQLEIYFHP
ncbi:MAG TPA: hypothetical protein VK638_10115 [Edaphobacter sp.]|nr:hypothetical protein [Edaphobacter sp.]